MSLGRNGLSHEPRWISYGQTGQSHYLASQLSVLLLLVGPGAQGPPRGSWALRGTVAPANNTREKLAKGQFFSLQSPHCIVYPCATPLAGWVGGGHPPKRFCGSKRQSVGGSEPCLGWGGDFVRFRRLGTQPTTNGRGMPAPFWTGEARTPTMLGVPPRILLPPAGKG